MEEGDPNITTGNRLIRLCMSECDCNGFIHKVCLKKWVLRNPPVHSGKCPICRTNGENFTLLECESPKDSKDGEHTAIEVRGGDYERIESNNPTRRNRTPNYVNYCSLFALIMGIVFIFLMLNLDKDSKDDR